MNAIVSPSKLMEINDYESIACILKSSQLSALLPSTVANRFDFQPQSGKLFSVDVSLIYRKDRFQTRHQKLFISRVLKLLSPV